MQANQYYSPTVLNNINNRWGNTPLANQNLQNFPDTSVAIKPTYLFAYANQATQLQYWTGATNSTTPDDAAIWNLDRLAMGGAAGRRSGSIQAATE